MERLSSLTLTRNELLVFLSVMGAKTMNGLEDDPLAGLEEHKIAERLNSGEQSLINRGLLVIGENSVTWDDTLVALVGSSVVPGATFLLTRIEPDGSNEIHYFNATSEILVEQTSPRPGIHVFGYLPDVDALGDRLETLLAPFSPLSRLNGEELSLSADDMARFMEQCKQDNGEAARQTLIQAGWPEEAAGQLVHDCATHPVWVGVAAWNLRNGEPKSLDPVMVFLGDDHCWLVENAIDNTDELCIRCTTGVHCAEKLTALSAPLSYES
jgi:hypothetical protein